MAFYDTFLAFLDQLWPDRKGWARNFMESLRSSFLHLAPGGAIPYDNTKTYNAGTVVSLSGQFFIALVDGIPPATSPTLNTGDANWGILAAGPSLTGLPLGGGSWNCMVTTGNNGAGDIDLVTNGISGATPNANQDKVAFVYNITDGAALSVVGFGLGEFNVAIGTTGGAGGHATLHQNSAANLSAKHLLLVTFVPHS